MAILEPKPQEVFHQRFKSGDQCLVALVDGRVVGYAWFTLDRTHREQRFDYLIEPPDDHVYAYDAYIHPDFRLRGTWVMLQQELWNECLRLGKAGICVLIDLENEASRKSHVRLNYRSVRRVTVVRVGSTRWFIERALRVC